MLRPTSLLITFLGCLVLVTVACSKDEDKKANANTTTAALGEPIGAEVPASGKMPALSLALAVSKGQDPVPVLPHVVGVVSTAVGGCPDFVAEDKEVVAVNFTVEHGKMKVAPRSDSTGIKCLVAALDGKDVGGTNTNVAAARVEIKLPPVTTK